MAFFILALLLSSEAIAVTRRIRHERRRRASIDSGGDHDSDHSGHHIDQDKYPPKEVMEQISKIVECPIQDLKKSGTCMLKVVIMSLNMHVPLPLRLYHSHMTYIFSVV